MSGGSIYRSPEGRAEVLALYDEALGRLGAGYESRTVATSFGDTHVLMIGPEDAPPLMVLQGGNFLNPLCLAWFLPLADEHRLIAPDIVGQPGRSAETRPSSKGDGHARWMVEVLDGLWLDSVPFVGISYGAGVILRVAGYAPERISRAVLVSPSGIAIGSIPRMIKDVALPMLLYRAFPNRERLLRAARPILTEPEDLYVRQLGAVYRNVRLDRDLPRAATPEELAGYEAPTLLFAAQDDLFFPSRTVVPAARKLIPNLADAEPLPGCRHVPSAEAFDYINDRILTFLR